MIPFDVKWADLTQNHLSGVQPVYMLRRERAHQEQKAWAGKSEVASIGEFWVPQEAVLALPETHAFAVTKVGDCVRIPLFAYKTGHLSLASLFGLGVQIGMAALAELRNYTSDAAKSVVLILGHEVTDLRPAEDAFRCYVGIAVQTR